MSNIVFQILPAFRFGGAEIMAKNLILELNKRNYKVIVLSLFDEHTEITKEIEDAGIKIIYLNKKSGLDISVILKIRKLVNEYKPISIHTHQYVLEYVYLATLFKNIKIIHTIHNVAEKEVGKSRILLRKLLFKNKKIVPIAISPLVKKSMEKVYNKIRRNYPIIYNGINLKNCKEKQKFEFDEKIKFLTIGRLEEQKNQKTLINAISKIKKYNIGLEVIGEGSLKSELEEEIKRTGLEKKVILLGKRNNVYDYLQNADFFILPSKWEGMPITLIEAMGTGIPIIASKVGGVEDMIEDNISGILCLSDENSIRDSIIKGIEMNIEKRKQLALKAKIKSKKFSVEEMTENYIKEYRT